MAQTVSDVTQILDYKKAKKEASKTRRAITEQMAADEKTKENLVKKALATQRAKYGAGGMAGGGMTTNAVLARLRDETAQPYEEKRRANLEKLRNTKAKKPNLLNSILTRFEGLMG